MKIQFALTALAAGVLSFALAAPAAAAVDIDNDTAQPTIAQSGHGDHGKPDNTGKPEEPGQPDGPGAGGQGQSDGVGPSSRDLPTLPDNASPKAHVAVEAAYAQFEAISIRIAAIRELEPGQGRNDALNALFADFGEMLHNVSDVVHEADVDGDEDGGDGDTDDVELALDEEGDDADNDADNDADVDADEDKDADEDNDDDDDAEDDGDPDDDQDKKDADDED